MKKILVLFGVVIMVFVLAGFIIFTTINKNLKSLNNIKLKTIDLSSLVDGTYNGSFSVFPVEVELNVIIANKQMKDIKILKHDNGKGQPAEKIVKSILDKQSIDVDVIAGATYSSRVIQKAIENALGSKKIR